jgi:hypothetical protein
MASIDVRQGRTRAWTGTVKDSAGNALTNTYSGSETLSVSLWPVGDINASTLTTSSVVWLNATNATVTITLTQADTAALSAGIYESNITVSAGGSTYDAFDSLVVVKPSKSNAAWLVQPLEVVASWAGFADLDDAEQIQLSRRRQTRLKASAVARSLPRPTPRRTTDPACLGCGCDNAR